MSNANRVGSFTQQAFGNVLLGSATGVSGGSVANAIGNIAILQGGLTSSGNTATSGMAIVRRITIANPSASLSTTTISVGQNSSGGSLVANSQALTNITATNTYADLVLSSSGNTTCLNGNVSSVLYVNLTANAVSSSTFDVFVYGDVVKP